MGNKKISFDEVLEALRKEANSTSEQGTLFERLMVAILPQLPKHNIEKCWLWSEWPDRGRVTGQDARDIGIDLVAQLKDGEYQAIQCKFFAREHNLQKRDIDSFFTASGKEWVSSRLIISTTDHWSPHATEALKNQKIGTQDWRFSKLAELSIDWDLANPLRTKIVPEKKKSLKLRQKEALKAVIEGFKEHNRGKLIMACGTGKTLTSLHIAEKQAPPNGRILFLVPSISLLSQTLDEWAWQRTKEHRYLAVCSDSHVGRNEDGVRVSELTIPATTNEHHISNELKKDFEELLKTTHSF